MLGLAVAASLVSSSTGRSATITYPVYDHARVLGVVGHAGGEVALTFDDCSNANAWRSILDTLHARNVRASFFCIGEELRAHPRLARRVRSNGNLLCNHTWSHRDLTTLSAEGITRQIRRSRTALSSVAGSRCRFFRPPYGAYNRSVLRIAGRLGYRWAALWNVDPRDWEEPGSAVIKARVLGRTRSGSIVLLHCLPQTAAALPGLIRSLRRRHLQPVGLSTVVRRGTPAAGGWPSYSQL